MYSPAVPTFRHCLKIRTHCYIMIILMSIYTHISTNHICGHSVVIPNCTELPKKTLRVMFSYILQHLEGIFTLLLY
jgi:hypothetical protein